MMKWLTGVVLVALGCSSGPHEVAGNAALLSYVSVDQSWVALLDHDTRYPNGTHVGRLSVQPVTGGSPIVLDGNSPGGTFERGRALWYQGGVTIVQEGTPALPHYYGTLNLWLPGLTSGIKVGNIVHDYYPSQDGSTVVFMDYTTPSQSSMGKLVAVSSSTCGTGTCMPVVIAEGILVTQAAWRISNDGKYVLATVKGANPGDPGMAILVQPATGDQLVLSSTAGTRSPAMTPLGDTIAWVEGLNRIMTQPTSATAATQVPVKNSEVDSIAMIDANDYIAKVRDLNATTNTYGPPSLVRVGASSMSLGMQRPVQFFVSQYVPGVTTRYLFYSTIADTNGTTDLWVLDLGKSVGPVQIASYAVTPIYDGVVFSDDGSTIRWFDNYDPTTRQGSLYVTSLSSIARNFVGTTRGGGFEPGTTRLLYINAPDPNTGAGVLTLLPAIGKPTLVEGVGLLDFQDPRSLPPRTFYTQRTGSHDDGVWYIAQP